MKLIYSYIRRLFAHIPTLLEVAQIQHEIFSPANQRHRPVLPGRYILLTIFCFIVFSDAQAQSAGEQAVEGLNDIRIPEGGIVIGDSLPEAFWEQELQVINHPQGLAKIKLSDYRDKLLVLDFLNTACVPCIASVDKWHQLQERYRQEVVVLPVHLYGDNQRIGPFAKEKGWTLPIAVGNTADTIINRLFYSYKSFGQVWIHDGRLLAIPHHKDVTPEVIGKALRRIPLGIIMNDFLTYFDRRYTGGAGDEQSK
ncbi:TlpA family protein disulfide reductase [Sphingobacterium pedocola]|uniref:TlpA family protein disulfide reductase n=1 Tax=Sphingobacterium pedocola TaxID=2082722 RepID=UPI0018CA0FD1|nr:redoxin domain-containing protein [Sphingobacterium pedocola]